MTSIEDYLIDSLNKKYAGRIFRKVNTEFEKQMEGRDPSKTEYEWMVARALELHNQINKGNPEKQEEVKSDKETKD